MIFYFSGTGNTKWAAEYLAAKTGETLLFIPDELKGSCEYTLHIGERIGFCFPVHGWQVPGIVRRFKRKMTLHNAEQRYCFALCTCGDSIGKTIDILNKELARHFIHTVSAYSLQMPESYVCLPFMHTDPPERERSKIEQAKALIEIIGNDIINMKPGCRQLIIGPMPNFLSYVVGRYFNSRMITDKKFMVDAAMCVRCGKCAVACPTGNIIGGKGEVPQWRHDGSCTTCLACYHHCPKHAINYGERTKKRGQYYFKG